MITDILPVGVGVAEAVGANQPDLLYPEEAAAVVNAVDKRRREFALGRTCARRALAELAIAPAPIPYGERGMPIWPAGVVGSITHCPGYTAAVVARATQMRAVGIDAEPHQPLPAGVLPEITLPGERIEMRQWWHAAPDVHWDRVLFSAKESVYKAWFSLTRQWLGFDGAHISFTPNTGTFTARLLEVNTHRPTSLTGRWLVRTDLIITTVTAATSERP